MNVDDLIARLVAVEALAVRWDRERRVLDGDAACGDVEARRLAHSLRQRVDALVAALSATAPNAGQDHPPCCGPTCEGTSCWDCQGTGHPHAPDAGQRDAQVRAEALREAAEEWPEDGLTRAEAQQWLDARTDREARP